MVSEINILTKFRKTICYIFIINCTSFEKMHVFSITMQLTWFLMASKNIYLYHVCHNDRVQVIFLFVHVIVMYE